MNKTSAEATITHAVAPLSSVAGGAAWALPMLRTSPPPAATKRRSKRRAAIDPPDAIRLPICPNFQQTHTGERTPPVQPSFSAEISTMLRHKSQNQDQPGVGQGLLIRPSRR